MTDSIFSKILSTTAALAMALLPVAAQAQQTAQEGGQETS